MKLGYLRISTDEQNIDLQKISIQSLKPDRIIEDIDSGNNNKRPGWLELQKLISSNLVDQIIVYKLDRLGRDPVELINFFDILEDHNTNFISVSEPWLSDWNQSPMSFLTWWLQLGLSRFELLLLKERQRAGIAAAQARGQHMGRPRKNEQK